MASSSVTYRLTESYLTDLLEGADWSTAPSLASDEMSDLRDELVRHLLDATYNREFKPRSKAGELVVLTFQLDPQSG
jgi:hypothetical protein